MKILAFAIPFFIAAIFIEVMVDRLRGTKFYRFNDAVASLSGGVLNTTSNIFMTVIPDAMFGLVLEHFALFKMKEEWFGFSWSGLAAWVGVFLAYDFLLYWRHRMMHEVNILWGIHVFHHQSEEFNLTTALRQGGIHTALLWFFYLPLFFAGVPLSVFLILAAVSQLYQILPHTRHVGKLGALELFLNTPSHHRVHHGRNDLYVDRNYGGVLIIWDRLFGTFQEEREEVPVVFGVKKPLQSWNIFYAHLPVFAGLWRDMRNANDWKQGILNWFRPTGSRPAGAEKVPVVLLEDDDLRKYDPPLSRGTLAYSLFQFSLCVLSVAPIMLYHKSMPGLVLGGLCLFVWSGLFTIGALNEGRAYAPRAEWMRLGLAGAGFIAVYIVHADLFAGAMLAAACVYLALSAGGLAWMSRNTGAKAMDALETA